jgi:hypothetical protein
MSVVPTIKPPVEFICFENNESFRLVFVMLMKNYGRRTISGFWIVRTIVSVMTVGIEMQRGMSNIG